MTVEQQARALAAMVVCGAALGAACDVLGLLRRALRAGGVLTGILDLFWGILGALAVVLAGLRLKIDLLRAYVRAGVLAGMGVYALLIGLPLRRMVKAVQGRVKKDEKEEKEAKKGRKMAN